MVMTRHLELLMTDEELTDWLRDLLNIVDYALQEVESGCKPDLSWERDKVNQLRRKLDNVD